MSDGDNGAGVGEARLLRALGHITVNDRCVAFEIGGDASVF